jgi:hypothetical protein
MDFNSGSRFKGASTFWVFIGERLALGSCSVNGCLLP